MIEAFLRTNLRRLLTKEKDLALEDKIPSLEDLGGDSKTLMNSGFIFTSLFVSKYVLTALITKRFIILM